MKPILIAVSCYALTYLTCTWVGGSNQIESFLEDVAQHENTIITSPPTRTSPFDQARPPAASSRSERQRALAHRGRGRRFRADRPGGAVPGPASQPRSL